MQQPKPPRENNDPERVIYEAGCALAEARESEDRARGKLRGLVRRYEGIVTEVRMAEVGGVDRMTVRKMLGKS